MQAGDGQCCFSQSNFTTVAGLLRNNYTLEVDVNNPGLGTCFILFQDVSICFSPGVLCMVMWRSFFIACNAFPRYPPNSTTWSFITRIRNDQEDERIADANRATAAMQIESGVRIGYVRCLQNISNGSLDPFRII